MMHSKKPTPKKRPSAPSRGKTTRPVGLRIIGGHFRGRKLAYGGDTRVRPMKDRIREALFNLVGPSIREKHAVDLFAGTGALALEAISRGATGATFIEQHLPTAAIVRQNIATLGVEAVCEVIIANVFIWGRREPCPSSTPWVVFCSPPYDFYIDRTDEMLDLIGTMMTRAPAESIVVVESDTRFDFGCLPEPDQWNVRTYAPAVVGVYRVEQ